MFGQFWLLLFLLPLPLPQAGDGRRYSAAADGTRGKNKGAAAAKDSNASAKNHYQNEEAVKGENPALNCDDVCDGGAVSHRERTKSRVKKRRKGNGRAGMVKLSST